MQHDIKEINKMNEEQNIIEGIKAFTEKADALESKAFNDSSYQENGFVEDFNALFNEYAYGKQNRTLSGLNFRQPPRYDNLKFAVKAENEQLSKTRYQITFWTEPKFKSLRFIVDKKLGEWRIIRFETFIGISNQTKTKGEAIWRKHKL